MILTDDEKFAMTCRSLRNQGREGMSWLAHQRLGYNYRMSEINAVLGLTQMSRIDQILADRRRVANAYINRLMTSRYVIVPTVTEDITMSWFVFVVRLTDLFAEQDRDAIIQTLRASGIGCSNYFPPIHLQPYISKTLGTKPGDYPVCEYVAARTIALPFFNKLTDKQIDIVVEELEKACEKTLMNRGKR
jgi:perosamine synthetase